MTEMLVQHEESGERGRMTIEAQEDGRFLVKTVIDGSTDSRTDIMDADVLRGIWDEWKAIAPDRFENEEAEAAGEPMLCGDCNRAIFYSYDDEKYHHVLEPGWGCFLIAPEFDEAGARADCPNCKQKGGILNNPITAEMACMLCGHMWDGETKETLHQGAPQIERESE